MSHPGPGLEHGAGIRRLRQQAASQVRHTHTCGHTSAKHPATSPRPRQAAGQHHPAAAAAAAALPLPPPHPNYNTHPPFMWPGRASLAPTDSFQRNELRIQSPSI